MIKQYKLDILHFFIFILLITAFVIIQSSLIVRSLSFNSPPQLWIIFIAYFSVYKPPAFTISMIYLTSFFYTTLTSMSFGKLLFLSSFIFIVSRLGKHFDLKNPKIFFLFCTGCTVLLPLADGLLSAVIPLQSAKHYPFFGWILTIISTALCVILVKPLMSHLDHWLESLHLPFEKRFLK